MGYLFDLNLLYIASQSIYNNISKEFFMANKNIGRARILQQMKHFKKEELDYLYAEPLESDIYTWHFTFRGPENTDFHEGLYHGQILLPFQYPFKPPDIIFTNKNGRFEVNTKICLTITQYHAEEWNSAWTIRTMLEAVISLFNQRVMGHGYLESSSEVRRYMAIASHNFTCEKCGKICQILKPRPPISLSAVKQEIMKEEIFEKQEVKLQYKEIQQRNEQRLEVPQNISQRKTSSGSQKTYKSAKSQVHEKNEQKIISEHIQEQQYEVRKKTSKKHRKPKKKVEYITPQGLFLRALKKGNDQYLQVMASKKLHMS